MATPGTVVKSGGATAEEQQQFVDMVAPLAQKYAQQNGWHMPSIIVSMAAHECGWGFSDYAVNYKNILSIGCWTGHVGTRYSSFEECVKDFFVHTAFGKSQEARDATTFDALLAAYTATGYSGMGAAWDRDWFYDTLIPTIEKYGLTSIDNGGGAYSPGSTSGDLSGSGLDSLFGTGTGGSIAGKAFTTAPKERDTARVEDGGNPELKTFYRINMTGAQFIKQVLAPYCRSRETGQGAYRLWFDDAENPDGSPGVRLNFKPDQYANVPSSMSDKLLEGIDRRYVFRFGTGVDSSVLDFNPSYTGMVVSLLGGFEVEASTTDAITNDVMSVRYGKGSDAKRPSTGDSKYDDLRGIYRIGDSSFTLEEVQNRAANLWYQMASYGYTAELTVVGDPQIDPQTLCTVTSLTPTGLPHHSSGAYLIHRVVDSISGGAFQSQLSLVRNAIQIGTDESGGVDITLGMNTSFVGDAAGLITGSTGSGLDSLFGGGTAGQSTGGQYVASGPAAQVIQSAMDWAVGIANDDSHTYSQAVRWGPSYDCSSLVISAYEQAGVPFKESGASYTGDMRQAALKCGFHEHNELCGDCTNAQPGDIYLAEQKHAAMYLGNGKTVEGLGPSSGIAVSNWSNRSGYRVVLRYGS